MKDLIDQIQKALDSELYYLALFACLAIPDICGAIGSENGRAKDIKYKKWFNKYLADKYSQYLTAEDCYRFRCSFLHQSSSQHPLSSYSRILFVEPLATTHELHCNVLNDALNIDIGIFCRDILLGAEEWLQDVEGTEPYESNYAKLMKRYPKGLPPYIGGVPVIS